MGTWQIVGRSWKVAWKGLGIVGLVTLVQLIQGLGSLPLTDQERQVTGRWLLLILALYLVNFFVWPLIQGGCLVFANSQLAQQPLSPLAGFREGARRLYGRLLGSEAVMMAVFLVFALVSVVLFVLALLPAANAPAVSVVLTLVVLVPVAVGLYLLMLITVMAQVAIAVEGLGVFGGIKKGLKVGRASLGKLVLVSLVLFLTLIPGIAIWVISEFLKADGGLAGRLVALLLQSIVAALLAVLFSASYVQIYRHRAGLTQASS